MNMLLLLVSAVILPIMVLAAPSTQRTSDDLMNSEPDSNADETTIQLVKQAQSLDPNARLAAVSQIRGLFSKGAEPNENCFDFLQVLVNCLKSTDEKLLVEAAGALANIADGLVRDETMSYDDYFDDAMHVADAGAVPPLLKLLQSPNLEVRKQTVRALANITCFASVGHAGEVVEAGAVPLLVNLLQSPDMELCEYTVLALRGIAYNNVRQVVEAGAVPLLVKLLQSPNMKVCENTALALSVIGNEKAREVVEAGAVPLLVKLLQSPNMKVCEYTAVALRDIAVASDDLGLAVIEAGALLPLLNLLKSQNKEVCEEAAWAIESIFEKTPDLGHCIDVEHIQIMMENEVVGPFCNLLERNDEGITLKVLRGIKKVLNNAQKREKVIELIEKRGVLQKIEQLNTKESEFILKMIEKQQLSKGCVVCFDKKIDFAFKPCWHACVCEECSRKISICPMCRQIISKKRRVYMP